MPDAELVVTTARDQLEDLRERLAEAERAVTKWGIYLDSAKKEESEARHLLSRAGIDPDGDINAQVVTIRERAMKAAQEVMDIMEKLDASLA